MIVATKTLDGPTIESSKEAYEKIVDIIKYQTGGPGQQLPATAAESTIHMLTIDYNSMDCDVAKSCLSVATARGDVLKIRGREARTRYAVLDEEGIEAIAREEMEQENPRTEPLQAAIEKLWNKDPRDQELVGHANKLMMELRETLAEDN